MADKATQLDSSRAGAVDTLPCATHEQIDETVEVLRASAFAMARDLYPGRPDTLLLAMADLLLRRAIAKLQNR